jgi:hypothetical protein
VNVGNVQRIERLNYIIGGLMVIIAAITQHRTMAAGVVVGVALSCLNFALLRRLVFKWTAEAADGRSTTGSSLLMLPKTIGMMLVVTLVLIFLPISAIGFLVGFSVFVVSIAVDLVMSAFLPTPPSSPESNEQNHG